MRVEKDKAYLLHKRPYRDNSLLLDLLTLKNGKISFIIKTSKNPKKNKMAVLQPCQMLEVNYILKPNLSSLTDVEIFHNNSSSFNIAIDKFMFYQYINELLIYLLHPQLECEQIFYSYQKSLLLLSENYINSALRLIEISLINQYLELPKLENDVDGEDIKSENNYYFYPELGLSVNPRATSTVSKTKISGKTILSFLTIQKDNIDEITAKEAQGITIFLINHMLAGKPLKTRQVYQELNSYLK